MKELRSTTANMALVIGGDEPQTVVEVVLLVSEPKYSIDASGSVAKARNLEDMRFSASPKGLRDLADVLLKLADEADESARKALGTTA